MIKLIELVRKGIIGDFLYVTIDDNGKAFGSNVMPKSSKHVWFFGNAKYTYLGNFKLTCNFIAAVLDIKLLQSKGIY